MQVLFEAKKKLSYGNRLLRVYFNDVTFFIASVLIAAYIKIRTPESGWWILFGILGLSLLYRMYGSHMEARIYITKVVYSEGQVVLDYLFINKERSHSFSIDNIPYFEKTSGNKGANISFNMPNNQQFVQYSVGAWNEDMVINLMWRLDRIRAGEPMA